MRQIVKDSNGKRLPVQHSEHLDEALSCIRSLPERDPRVRMGMRSKFDHQIDQFLDSDLSVDWVQEGLARQTVGDKIEALLLEAYEQDNPKEKFIASFRGYMSDTLGSPKPTYTVYFPINFSAFQTPPNRFERGVEIERISHDEWENYRGEAEQLDEIAEFFSQHPNDFDEDIFTFWEADVDARDVVVPPNIVYDAVVTLLGQIQYSFRGLHPRDNSDGLPKHSWSNLRAPPILLVANEDGDINYAHAIDRNHRRAETVQWVDDNRRNRFDSIPPLNSGSVYDKKLLDAFHAYQRGMAEPRKHSSFLYFWQGLERLATRDDERANTSDTVERARFVYEQLGDIDPIFDDVLRDLADKRNSLVHEGPNTTIARRFQEYTKVLLDGMITLYLECRDDFTMQEMNDLLEYGPGDWKRAGLVRKLSEREFDFERK